MVWYGTVQYGMVWYGMVWYGIGILTSSATLATPGTAKRTWCWLYVVLCCCFLGLEEGPNQTGKTARGVSGLCRWT